MNSTTLFRNIAARRILGSLQHRIEGMLKRTRVIFFRCDPIPEEEIVPADLVEADAARFEQWRREEPGFPWPSPDEYARRAREGHRPFALLVEGHPACYGWVGLLQAFWLGELNQGCSIDAPMTWIWDCVTPASLRNRGHYTHFLRALRWKFRDCDLLIFCHALNSPSRRAIRRSGFEPWALVSRTPSGTRIKVLNPRFRFNITMQPMLQRG